MNRICVHVGIVLLIMSLISSSAQAIKFRPFVEGAAVVDLIEPIYSTHNLKAVYSLGTYYTRGSAWNLGVAAGDFGVYFGYHFTTGGWSDSRWWYPRGAYDGDLWYNWENTSWKEKRFQLGGRWIPNSEKRELLNPVVGTAISLGKSKLWYSRMDYYYDNDSRLYTDYERHDFARPSGTSIGIMGEIGVLVNPGLPIDFLLTVQGHRWEASFTDDFDNWIPDHYVVVMPSFNLSIRYLFPEIKL